MAVSYVLKDTNIHLMDVNVVPGLLLDPDNTIKNPDYKFLASENDYNAFQSCDRYLHSPNFIGNRFPPRHWKLSRLWQRYQANWGGGPVSFWSLQIPIYLRPRKRELTLAAVPQEHQEMVSVDVYITLNALGWSTNIVIRLRQELKPSQLADLCANLRGKAYGGVLPYRLNGEPKAAEDVFRYYRQLLRDELFAKSTRVQTSYSRLIFTDVMSASGSLTPYNELPLPLIQIFARTIDGQIHDLQTNYARGVEIIDFRDLRVSIIDPYLYNFSISDFNQGVFTFLQDEVLGGKMAGGVRCFANNTREARWLVYSWVAYARMLDDAAKKHPLIGPLLKNGSAGLQNLRKTYVARTSRDFFNLYAPVQSFAPIEEAQEAEDAPKAGGDGGS